MKIKMTSLFRALALASFAFVCLGVPIKAYLQSLSAVSEPAPSQSKGQAYPTRPIRSIMTVAGGADVVARLVAQGLTEALGQPVVVEAQAGAGGAIGAETVARAAPDGHTIMLASASTVVMSRLLSKSARLDPIKDFTPITKAFETVALVVTSPSLPVDSVQELIEYARRNPGKLSFGTSGVGATHYLSVEAIRPRTGIDEIVRVLTRPEVRSKAEDIGFVIDTSTPEELTETLRRDIAYTSRIVEATGIRPE